jgi:hypothetical protein
MADFDGSVSRIGVPFSDTIPVMKHRWLGILFTVLPGSVVAQDGAQTDKPYARIAILRPHDGETVDFEAGYIRHLEWHRQAKDSWIWYGWSVTFGDRQRWFVYASFGHSAESLDHPVPPAEDERDNILNVTPHAQFLGNAVYEYLPGLSRGTGAPTPTARLELTTVELDPGAETGFEAALGAGLSHLSGETLWYRMVAGGATPRYVRLRPRGSLSAILDGRNEQPLPDEVSGLVTKATVEILTLRPTMSYGLSPAREESSTRAQRERP